MTVNIMNQYIDLTKKQINAYMKLVLGKKYKKQYCDIFIEKYINIRYYNFYENEVYNSIRKKILEHLKKTEEDIVINNINDREIIQTMRVFFAYVLYFDNVVYYKDLKQKIEQISKLRKKLIKSNIENFEQKLYEKMSEFIIKKEELKQKIVSKEFFLKISNYPDKLNVFRVNLKFDIKFPIEYSEFAINKAFEIGVINEDKLIIEYYLTVSQILKDILKQNFKRKYIVEFSETIFKKRTKLKSLLNIINNIAIQDKISLKIKYKKFIEHKEKIYELMRDGYRITIVLDNSFDATFKNIESLQMFEFVIVNKNLKKYNEIIDNKANLHNIIEI